MRTKKVSIEDCPSGAGKSRRNLEEIRRRREGDGDAFFRAHARSNPRRAEAIADIAVVDQSMRWFQ